MSELEEYLNYNKNIFDFDIKIIFDFEKIFAD